MVVEKLSLIEDILFFEIFVKGWVGVLTVQMVTDEHAEQFRLMKKSVLLLSGNSLEIRHRFPSFFLRCI